MKFKYDVIVVGGGHAGCEAAAAAARLGSTTLLITLDINKFAQMSCNPAVGGIAKGQIVREIDALGGYTGIVTDRSTIQFRMLNSSKGSAVWSPRAQCDKIQFSEEWRSILESIPNLYFWQDSVNGLIIENDSIQGIQTQLGVKFYAPAVVLTAGTFLNGKMFVGKQTTVGGRAGDNATYGITEQLSHYNIEAGRMKTGTPVRVDGRTIDFKSMVEQKGDVDPWKFSFSDASSAVVDQISCYITETSKEVHDELRKGFSDSPMFSGMIKGIGPRYCPSVEDKLRTFPDKDVHHIFVEPEGRDICEYYLNGFSSSLPFEVQASALSKIRGFEQAQIIRPGYAVEYDFFQPTQLYNTLESQFVSGLYFAGQVNGTTGYEEAAGQGLIAGINAHRKLKADTPFTLDRKDAYLGVLIDDLIKKGVDEPYRMFTSRAEYRISLRQDNVDIRLLEYSKKLGLRSKTDIENTEKRKQKIEQSKEYFKNTRLKPEEINKLTRNNNQAQLATQSKSVEDTLKRPDVNIESLFTYLGCDFLKREDMLTLYSDIQYSGYILREKLQVNKMYDLSSKLIPENFNYATISSITIEARQKLQKYKPKTIEEAIKIPGISPNDISQLLIRFGR